MTRHLTASAVVLDENDRVLLVHHRKLGLWIYPGGHLDPDETPDEAAVREVAEETGIEIEVLGSRAFTHTALTTHPAPWAIIEMDVTDPANGPHRHIDFVYLGRAVGGVLTARPDEVAGVRWVTPDELRALPAPAELRDLVTAASDHLNGRPPATGGVSR